MAAADVKADFPTHSTIIGRREFTCLIPIGTGGLPSPTGAIGVPSGVTIPQRLATGCGITRVGTGLYEFTFPTAPNGSVRAWVDLSSTVADINCQKKDVGTGYVQLQCKGPTGAALDPANGDCLAIEYIAFSRGPAAGGL
jgi:hypothetical protein